MAKTFTKLTRPAMRKLANGDKLNEHGITFERLANGDGVFTVVALAVNGMRWRPPLATVTIVAPQ